MATTTTTQGNLFDIPAEPAFGPDMASFDWIVVNSSAGKDSQAMLDYLVELADRAGARDRMVVVHCDLGRVEWEGTRELAERQAAHYGIRFIVVSRPQGDLLDQVIERRASLDAKGKTDAPAWPSSTARYCTSDHKTSQVKKVLTALTAEKKHLGRPVRILNCLGLRSQESPARAKKSPLGEDNASNTLRQVTRWLPIFDWTVEDVWARINASGVEHHRAYDLGMPRLSCCFCVLSSVSALTLAAKHNPALAAEYAAVEAQVGHTFKADLSMADIIAAAARAEPVTADDWTA